MGEAKKWGKKAKKLGNEIVDETKNAAETGLDFTKMATVGLAEAAVNTVEGLSAKEEVGDSGPAQDSFDMSGEENQKKIEEAAKKKAAAYMEGMNGRKDTFLGGSVGDDENIKKKKLLGS